MISVIPFLLSLVHQQVNETLHWHNGELYNVKARCHCLLQSKRMGFYVEGVCTCRRQIHYYSENMKMDDVDDDYISENVEPDIEAVSWEVEVYELLKRPDRFQELNYIYEIG